MDYDGFLKVTVFRLLLKLWQKKQVNAGNNSIPVADEILENGNIFPN